MQLPAFWTDARAIIREARSKAITEQHARAQKMSTKAKANAAVDRQVAERADDSAAAQEKEDNSLKVVDISSSPKDPIGSIRSVEGAECAVADIDVDTNASNEPEESVELEALVEEGLRELESKTEGELLQLLPIEEMLDTPMVKISLFFGFPPVLPIFLVIYSTDNTQAVAKRSA